MRAENVRGLPNVEEVSYLSCKAWIIFIPWEYKNRKFFRKENWDYDPHSFNKPNHYLLECLLWAQDCPALGVQWQTKHRTDFALTELVWEILNKHGITNNKLLSARKEKCRTALIQLRRLGKFPLEKMLSEVRSERWGDNQARRGGRVIQAEGAA